MKTLLLTDNIFERCRTLTSFEGREQKDAQGESLYERVKLQDRDRILIKGYALEAAAELSKSTAPFARAELTIDELRWTWLDSYTVPEPVPSLIERYLINRSMGAWLLDKVPDRAQYYAEEATRLAAGIPTLIFRALP